MRRLTFKTKCWMAFNWTLAIVLPIAMGVLLSIDGFNPIALTVGVIVWELTGLIALAFNKRMPLGEPYDTQANAAILMAGPINILIVLVIPLATVSSK